MCTGLQIDNVLMEKKIRPWINKKIIEYIGEPEPTLVDFICSKVVAGSAPQGILDDVQMVTLTAHTQPTLTLTHTRSMHPVLTPPARRSWTRRRRCSW